MPRMDDETRALLERVQRRGRAGREGPLPAEGDVVACGGCGQSLVVSQRQSALLRRIMPAVDSMGRHPKPVTHLYHNRSCQGRGEHARRGYSDRPYGNPRAGRTLLPWRRDNGIP
jgi:hypothetical protein